jgi:transposase-like protein
MSNCLLLIIFDAGIVQSVLPFYLSLIFLGQKGMFMEKYEVKILSYIRNFRKVMFICPLCRENNSCMLKSEEERTFDFKCDNCRKSYTLDLSSLEAIISSMGKLHE